MWCSRFSVHQWIALYFLWFLPRAMTRYSNIYIYIYIYICIRRRRRRRRRKGEESGEDELGGVGEAGGVIHAGGRWDSWVEVEGESMRRSPGGGGRSGGGLEWRGNPVGGSGGGGGGGGRWGNQSRSDQWLYFFEEAREWPAHIAPKWCRDLDFVKNIKKQVFPKKLRTLKSRER
jgi:hypothetical protein